MKNIYLLLILSIFTQLVLAQNKRALLVGISDYQCIYKYGGWNNIHGYCCPIKLSLAHIRA